MLRKLEAPQDIRDKETQVIQDEIIKYAQSKGTELSNQDLAYLLFECQRSHKETYGFVKYTTSIPIDYDYYTRNKGIYIDASGYTRAQIKAMQPEEYVKAIHDSRKRWEYNHRPLHD